MYRTPSRTVHLSLVDTRGYVQPVNEAPTEAKCDHTARVVYELGPEGWRRACFECGDSDMMRRIVRAIGLSSETFSAATVQR